MMRKSVLFANNFNVCCVFACSYSWGRFPFVNNDPKSSFLSSQKKNIKTNEILFVFHHARKLYEIFVVVVLFWFQDFFLYTSS